MKIRITIAVCALCILCLTIPARAAQEKLTVSKSGDMNMNCEQLWDEAYAMRSVIQQSKIERRDSKMQGRGIGVIGTAASYLVGTVTGGLSIAAAGLVASHQTEAKGDSAEAIQSVAAQRRALMVGIFGAKKCKGPIEESMQDSVPETPPAVVAPASGEVKPSYNP